MGLSESKVLVTGGAGLVGSHIVDELIKEGAKVVAFDSFVRGKMEHLDFARTQGDVEIIKADLRDRERMRAALKGVDYVFQYGQISSHVRPVGRSPRRRFATGAGDGVCPGLCNSGR